MNSICRWQVARKTQSSTIRRPKINETKANVVLEKHTIQYNIRKKTYKQKESKGQSLQKKELKWRTAAMRNSKNNINDTDNTRNLSRPQTMSRSVAFTTHTLWHI